MFKKGDKVKLNEMEYNPLLSTMYGFELGKIYTVKEPGDFLKFEEFEDKKIGGGINANRFLKVNDALSNRKSKIENLNLE